MYYNANFIQDVCSGKNARRDGNRFYISNTGLFLFFVFKKVFAPTTDGNVLDLISTYLVT